LLASSDGQHRYSSVSEAEIERKWCRSAKFRERRCGGSGKDGGRMYWNTVCTRYGGIEVGAASDMVRVLSRGCCGEGAGEEKKEGNRGHRLGVSRTGWAIRDGIGKLSGTR